MKQLATLFFLFLAINLQAQVSYGTIEYVRTTEMSFKMDGIDGVDDKMMKGIHEQMAAAGAFTDNFTATFSPDGFTFVEASKEATSIETEMGGGSIMIMEAGGGEPTEYYTDTKNGRMVNHDFIFDKGFLIEDAIEPLDWTITDETVPPSEATAGLDLKIATAVTPDGDTITAGYAPSLPVQVGPLNYYGLPGAIITLRIPNKTDNGGTMYRATSLKVSAEEIPLVKPTEGKKISLEKFRAEQSKRMKMMQRQYRH